MEVVRDIAVLPSSMGDTFASIGPRFTETRADVRSPSSDFGSTIDRGPSGRSFSAEMQKDERELVRSTFSLRAQGGGNAGAGFGGSPALGGVSTTRAGNASFGTGSSGVSSSRSSSAATGTLGSSLGGAVSAVLGGSPSATLGGFSSGNSPAIAGNVSTLTGSSRTPENRAGPAALGTPSTSLGGTVSAVAGSSGFGLGNSAVGGSSTTSERSRTSSGRASSAGVSSLSAGAFGASRAVSDSPIGQDRATGAHHPVGQRGAMSSGTGANDQGAAAALLAFLSFPGGGDSVTAAAFSPTSVAQGTISKTGKQRAENVTPNGQKPKIAAFGASPSEEEMSAENATLK